jgi:hypothetical protein
LKKYYFYFYFLARYLCMYYIGRNEFCNSFVSCTYLRQWKRKEIDTTRHATQEDKAKEKHAIELERHRFPFPRCGGNYEQPLGPPRG